VGVPVALAESSLIADYTLELFELANVYVAVAVDVKHVKSYFKMSCRSLKEEKYLKKFV